MCSRSVLEPENYEERKSRTNLESGASIVAERLLDFLFHIARAANNADAVARLAKTEVALLYQRTRSLRGCTALLFPLPPAKSLLFASLSVNLLSWAELMF